MKRILGTLALLALVAGSAHAHFLFLLPKPDGKADAVFSDGLEPDDAKLLSRIEHATFGLISGDKMMSLKASKKGDVLAIDDAGKAPAWVQGVCPYGVSDKGKEPFLLTYYARTLVNDVVSKSLEGKRVAPAITTLKLDLVLTLGTDAGPAVKVLWNDKPVEGAEVVLYVPGKKETVERKSDAKGLIKLAAPEGNGVYGVRAKHVVKAKGKYKEKEYAEERSYSTLTFLVSDVRKTSADIPE